MLPVWTHDLDDKIAQLDAGVGRGPSDQGWAFSVAGRHFGALVAASTPDAPVVGSRGRH